MFYILMHHFYVFYVPGENAATVSFFLPSKWYAKPLEALLSFCWLAVVDFPQ